MLTRDGRTVWVHDEALIVLDAVGEPAALQGVMFDITEKKRAEETQRRLQERLRHHHKLEAIGILAGGVVHEISNPINGILNYGQLIKDRLPADSPVREFAAEIIHESERVGEVARSLLTFARQDERLPLTRTSVQAAVRHALALIRTIIHRDQITLQVEIPDYLPDIHCRPNQVQQVVMNLMTNARDALNERYPGYDADKILRVSAAPVEYDDRAWVRTTVEDHGPGIDSEVQERIFDPFFTTKREGSGTGLGLSISHGIVEDHDGKLHVESEPGRFTRFHLDLPVADGDA